MPSCPLMGRGRVKTAALLVHHGPPSWSKRIKEDHFPPFFPTSPLGAQYTKVCSVGKHLGREEMLSMECNARLGVAGVMLKHVAAGGHRGRGAQS